MRRFQWPLLLLISLFIIITLVVTFLHGIYNYIPETNHVSTVYSVAAVLYLQSVLHVMLLMKFPTFYGTRKFITAFTSARHLSLSRASSHVMLFRL